MTPRHFGYGFGFERERERVTIADRSEDRWVIGAILGFVLALGGLALYVVGSGHGPTIALAPVDETSGQGTRPTLPTLPH
jgi:outer membrane lipoprotein SlyB